MIPVFVGIDNRFEAELVFAEQLINHRFVPGVDRNGAAIFQFDKVGKVAQLAGGVDLVDFHAGLC